MTNEMMRPCTLWGHTFDAMKILELGYTPYHYTYSGERKFGAYLDLPDRAEIKSHTVETPEEAFALVSEAITTIADALNAPVLATKEVLAGLPKDAKLMTETHFLDFDIDPDDPDGVDNAEPYWGYYEPKFVDHYENFTFTSVFGERIKANGCPKTAEYLRQFTLQGVRRVG